MVILYKRVIQIVSYSINEMTAIMNDRFLHTHLNFFHAKILILFGISFPCLVCIKCLPKIAFLHSFQYENSLADDTL